MSSPTIRADLCDRHEPSLQANVLQRTEEVRRLRAQGLPVRTIAQRFDVHPNTIYQDLSDQALAGNQLTTERRAAEVRQLVMRGVKKRKIATRLGISPDMIKYLKIRAPLLHERFGQRVWGLHRQGVSQAAIQRELKVSRYLVERVLVAENPVVRRRNIAKLHPARLRALRVLKLLEQGVNRNQVSRRLHHSWETIKRVIAIEAAGKPATIQSQGTVDPTKMRRLARQGLSQAAIARRTGTSPTSVRRGLGLLPPVPAERAALIKHLSEQGTSRTRMRRSFGIRSDEISRALPRLIAQIGHSQQRHRSSYPMRRTRTVAEFAEEIDVDIPEVQRAIDAGEIRVVRLGRRVLIPRGERQRLLRKAYKE